MFVVQVFLAISEFYDLAGRRTNILKTDSVSHPNSLQNKENVDVDSSLLLHKVERPASTNSSSETLSSEESQISGSPETTSTLISGLIYCHKLFEESQRPKPAWQKFRAVVSALLQHKLHLARADYLAFCCQLLLPVFLVTAMTALSFAVIR